MKLKKRVTVTLQTTGIFIFLIIALAFIAGAIRREIALSLIGAVFLVIWLYCILMTLISAVLQNGRVKQLSFRISPHEISTGDSVSLICSDNGLNLRLPGIVTRCRLLLSTGDGRQIKHDFDPAIYRKNKTGTEQAETFEVYERGAYFSQCDEFAVFDALGFFRFVFHIPCEKGPRLLVCPRPAGEPPSPPVRSGGAEHQHEFQLQRSDNLIDHRPYVPGDDPRRINWKLFSHGGELFVREGEPEPPVHSNIIILIDTNYDVSLYSARAGRYGVDLLCENALAAAIGFTEQGMDVLIGFSGSSSLVPEENFSPGLRREQPGIHIEGKTGLYLRGNSPAGLAAVFAYPIAIKLPASELPVGIDNRGILIFALPRSYADPSALSRFLDRRAGTLSEAEGRSFQSTENKAQPVELIFIYQCSGKDQKLDDAAETCTAFYNRKPGVRALRVKIAE